MYFSTEAYLIRHLKEHDTSFVVLVNKGTGAEQNSQMKVYRQVCPEETQGVFYCCL